jgi:hypothetical protein
MPLTGSSAKTLAAASLIRAGLCDDADAGVLIIQQNSGSIDEMRELVIAVTALSVRVLLATHGFDYEKALALIDQWITQYSKADAVAPS